MDNNVQEAQQIVQRLAATEKREEPDRWRLAELTFNSGMSARKWAEQIGVSAMTANRYKRIWERWGSGVTQGYTSPISFSECWDIVREPSSKSQSLTPTAPAPVVTPPAPAPAPVVRVTQTASTLPTPVTPDQITKLPAAEKAKVAEALARDPEVPAHVINTANRTRNAVERETGLTQAIANLRASAPAMAKTHGRPVKEVAQEIEALINMAENFNDRQQVRALTQALTSRNLPSMTGHLEWQLAMFKIGEARKCMNEFVTMTNNVNWPDQFIHGFKVEFDKLDQVVELGKATVGLGPTANLDWDGELAKLTTDETENDHGTAE